MTPDQLSDTIVDVLRALVDEGTLTLPGELPEAVTVERPKIKEHGDYATNFALQLGKRAGKNPRDLAGLVADRLVKTDGVAAADVAGPGFLNIRVGAAAQGLVARRVVVAGSSYGHSTSLRERVNLEVVSANPTGPVTLASAR